MVPDPANPMGTTRRTFLARSAAAGCAVLAGPGLLLADGRFIIPNSAGLLVVDMKKCQSCGTTPAGSSRYA